MTGGAEGDTMVCRACGNAERASEGYPCDGCGTFLCLRCSMQGVSLCRACQEKERGKPREAPPA